MLDFGQKVDNGPHGLALSRRYFSADHAADAPSATAVVIWRSGFFRTSPVTKRPGVLVDMSSSVRTYP